MGVCNCSMFCCTLLYVHSSFAIILMGKRELVALLSLSSWCLVMVEWLFFAVPWVCLQFVIVVFPDHTHLLFLTGKWTLERLHMYFLYSYYVRRIFEKYQASIINATKGIFTCVNVLKLIYILFIMTAFLKPNKEF